MNESLEFSGWISTCWPEEAAFHPTGLSSSLLSRGSLETHQDVDAEEAMYSSREFPGEGRKGPSVEC